ncbi:Bifunctional inhibitor/lipid-transfer protein/seed storage 2S albumin superfamily protein [Striga hermonthica]|uniref:Bifunctional inhibitor/lipid-transfer protein/seed storage 2S albumin superfamily protein n=1 Tax=Striga hermonthica TaxID=68872 RepID=A0A9N7MP03_STRHE|nr:Bifunctional inhibitor/lipid-transfer protein/seed storage 2S albumin superfamily protein [Striga hermonthica]
MSMISAKTGLALFLSCVAVLTSTTVVMAQCGGNFQGLVQKCSRYVQKTGPRESPSQECCNVVKNVDLPRMLQRCEKCRLAVRVLAHNGTG